MSEIELTYYYVSAFNMQSGISNNQCIQLRHARYMQINLLEQERCRTFENFNLKWRLESILRLTKNFYGQNKTILHHICSCSSKLSASPAPVNLINMYNKFDDYKLEERI